MSPRIRERDELSLRTTTDFVRPFFSLFAAWFLLANSAEENLERIPSILNSSLQACRPTPQRSRTTPKPHSKGLLLRAARISFSHRILGRWTSLSHVEMEAKPTRPLTHVPTVRDAHHLKGQPIVQQNTCLSHELGGRPLRGTKDPAR